MDVDAVTDLVATVKDVVFPLSAVVLVAVYPLAVLLMTIMEGQAAGPGVQASKAKPAPVPLRNRICGLCTGSEAMDKSVKFHFTGARILQVLVFFAAGAVTLTGLAGRAFAPARSPAGPQLAPLAPQPGSGEDLVLSAGGAGLGDSTAAAPGLGAACGAVLLGVAFALRAAFAGSGDASGQRPKRGSGWSSGLKRAVSGVLRRCASGQEVTSTRCKSHGGAPPDAKQAVPRHAPPADGGPSLWHSVDLHVKTWLDESTGLFRYINEIPKGALQKFELQPALAQNVIREDTKGSRKLKAFGRPVPFNYGCFPQTFRDPDEVDSMYGAPGDNDPLDVLDLTCHTAAVGEVVRCCVLGAVCLIDEGRADWKILAVNTEAKDPLSQARSLEDAERLRPGRVEEVLRWMDDFKQHSSDGKATLHFDVHPVSKAVSIIEQDHAAWRRLSAEADSSGYARGHWICSAQKEAQGHPQVLPPLPMPRMAVPGQKVRLPAILAGTSSPATAQPVPSSGRELVVLRQTSANSDGEESSASGMSSAHLSTDSDIGA